MIDTFLVLLPVFVVILVGLALRLSGLIDGAHWDAVDHVCYYVLFPAIIFKEIAAADFSNVPVFAMAFAMVAAILTMFAMLLAARKPLQSMLAIDGPQFTSLVQGATRWHTFIAFAIIPLYFGPGALALGAVSAAAMTPLLNVACVIVMSLYATGTRPKASAMALSIARNPFFLSSMGGVAWQVLGLPLPQLGFQVLDMIGKGALGLALLAVGAGLRFGEAMAAKSPVAAAVLLKLLAMPALMALWLWVFGRRADGLRRLCARPQDGWRRSPRRQYPHRPGDRRRPHHPAGAEPGGDEIAGAGGISAPRPSH
jgi:malonate transporter